MSKELIKKNIEYWDKRLAKYGLSGKSTLLDENMRTLEIETVSSWLDTGDIALDIGCANGISTLEYAKHCRSVKGIDLSRKMIDTANLLLKEQEYLSTKASFDVCNVLELDKSYGSFNTVISVRCLINIPSWQLQQKAIMNIYELIPPGGKFIFIEGTKDGLKRINELRQQFSLKPLKEPWYNNHFEQSKLFGFLEDYFHIKSVKNLDIYFLVSRVLYPHLCAPEQPSFENLCNTVGRILTKYASCNSGTTLLNSLCLIKK